MDTWFQDSQNISSTFDKPEPKMRKSLLQEAISSVAANIFRIKFKESTKLVTSSNSFNIDSKSSTSITSFTASASTAYVFIIFPWEKEKIEEERK